MKNIKSAFNYVRLDAGTFHVLMRKRKLKTLQLYRSFSSDVMALKGLMVF